MMHRCPCCQHEFSDPEPPAGLTRVQAKVLKAIEALIAKRGFSPSYDDIASATGLRSRGSVNRVIVALRERGFITFHPGRSRSIAIVQQRSVA
ncbi:LexA family protein [Kaistia adipata]|uniref:LexA family protein n=1 Tax=Kaistia adipata TaxID=166954 RepID=UPI00042287D3|nr:hypothetical protein [Kaistia adipata]